MTGSMVSTFSLPDKDAPTPDRPAPTATGFGDALEWLKAGKRVARAGWNGKGMWLQYVRGEEWGVHWVQRPGDQQITFKPLPFIMMKTVDNGLVPWLASQTDLLGTDYEVVG